MDVRDVRVVQRREDFRFALKACEPIGITRDRRRQDLDRDLPLQVRVGGAVDLAHPAHANLRGDFIRGRDGCRGSGPSVADLSSDRRAREDY